MQITRYAFKLALENGLELYGRTGFDGYRNSMQNCSFPFLIYESEERKAIVSQV